MSILPTRVNVSKYGEYSSDRVNYISLCGGIEICVDNQCDFDRYNILKNWSLMNNQLPDNINEFIDLFTMDKHDSKCILCWLDSTNYYMSELSFCDDCISIVYNLLKRTPVLTIDIVNPIQITHNNKLEIYGELSENSIIILNGNQIENYGAKFIMFYHRVRDASYYQLLCNSLSALDTILDTPVETQMICALCETSKANTHVYRNYYAYCESCIKKCQSFKANLVTKYTIITQLTDILDINQLITKNILCVYAELYSL